MLIQVSDNFKRISQTCPGLEYQNLLRLPRILMAPFELCLYVKGSQKLKYFLSLFEQLILHPCTAREGMYWVVHPRRPRDFPRPKKCPKGEARGTSRGPREILRSEGMCNPIHPDSRQCTAILSSFINTKGYIRKYIPAG